MDGPGGVYVKSLMCCVVLPREREREPSVECCVV